MDQNEEIKLKRLLSKTRRNFYVFLSVSTFICVLLAFCTPYWLQSWPRIHTEFKRLGLWEFCMNGYLSKYTTKFQTFYGCWWILAPYYDPIKEILTPPWFTSVQVLFSLVFILQIILNIVMLIYACKGVKNIERRTLLTKIMFVGQIVSALLTFVVVVVFGCRCFDLYWMPRPELNWPSWSYGLAVLSCFGMVYCAGFCGFMMSEEKDQLNQEVYQFPTQANSSVVRNKTSTNREIVNQRPDESMI